MLNTQNIVIGTAQIMPGYGVTTKTSLNKLELRDILHTCSKSKVNWIDTAVNYGEAHSLLADSNLSGFNIATKINISNKDIRLLSKEIYSIISVFGESNLKIIFAHDWEIANDKERLNFHNLAKEFENIKFGISVYNIESVEEIFKINQLIKIVQFPFNILNQNFGLFLKHQSNTDVEFWVRSIFLQGVLDFQNTRNPFRLHRDVIRFGKFCQSNHLSFVEATIAFLNQFKIDKVVVGFEDNKQFIQFLDCLNNNYSFFDFSFLNSTDNALVDPRFWNSKL
jgi:aryl-alcohol dehydrogenase-like predicted oxidoreductase